LVIKKSRLTRVELENRKYVRRLGYKLIRIYLFIEMTVKNYLKSSSMSDLESVSHHAVAGRVASEEVICELGFSLDIGNAFLTSVADCLSDLLLDDSRSLVLTGTESVSHHALDVALATDSNIFVS
jgi:hypothetical protein